MPGSFKELGSCHTKKETPANGFHGGKRQRQELCSTQISGGGSQEGGEPLDQSVVGRRAVLPSHCAWKVAGLRKGGSHCEASKLLQPWQPLTSQVHAHVVWEVGVKTAKQRVECPAPRLHLGGMRTTGYKPG